MGKANVYVQTVLVSITCECPDCEREWEIEDQDPEGGATLVTGCPYCPPETAPQLHIALTPDDMVQVLFVVRPPKPKPQEVET